MRETLIKYSGAIIAFLVGLGLEVSPLESGPLSLVAFGVAALLALYATPWTKVRLSLAGWITPSADPQPERTFSDYSDAELLDTVRAWLWIGGIGARPEPPPREFRAGFKAIDPVGRLLHVGLPINAPSVLTILGVMGLSNEHQTFFQSTPTIDRARFLQDLRLAILQVDGIGYGNIDDPLVVPLVNTQLRLGELTPEVVMERINLVVKGQIIIHQMVNRYISDHGGTPAMPPTAG